MSADRPRRRPAQRLKNPDQSLLHLPRRPRPRSLLHSPVSSGRCSTTAAQADDRADAADLAIPDDLPPVVLSVEPKVGATDVDPETKEIRVTFSKKMTDKSWSWPTGNKYAAPKVEGGTIHFERDERTCVMPVKLEPGKTYVVGVNSERFYTGFKDTGGPPRAALSDRLPDQGRRRPLIFWELFRARRSAPNGSIVTGVVCGVVRTRPPPAPPS